MLAQWTGGSYAPHRRHGQSAAHDRAGGRRQQHPPEQVLKASAALRIQAGAVAHPRGEKHCSSRQRSRPTGFVDLVEYHSDPTALVRKPPMRVQLLRRDGTAACTGYYHATAAAATRQFGGHGFKLLVGASYESMTITAWANYRQESPIPTTRSSAPAAGKRSSRTQLRQPDPDGPWDRSSARINYSFKERYLFEATSVTTRLLAFRPEEPVECVSSFSAAWRVFETVHGRSPEQRSQVQDPDSMRSATEHQLLLPRVAAANDQFHLRRTRSTASWPRIRFQRGHHLRLPT